VRTAVGLSPRVKSEVPLQVRQTVRTVRTLGARQHIWRTLVTPQMAENDVSIQT